MLTLFHYLAPPSSCGYLPQETSRLEYIHVATLTPEEYSLHLEQGWRRFGRAIFRPRCPACTACRSLRVEAGRFEPNRSQRRVEKANRGVVECQIGEPAVSRAKLDLYDRYHAFQTEAKGWPAHPAKDAAEYRQAFVDNPFPIEEWCYYLAGRLIGVGYVDAVPAGLSAIYFFYDPDERHRSLGTWNVLSILAEAARRQIEYVYLGYYVADCPSVAYKSNFLPNQLLGRDGGWHAFRTDREKSLPCD